MHYESAKKLLNSIPSTAKAYLYEILEGAVDGGRDFYVEARPSVVLKDYSSSNDSRNIGAVINSALAPQNIPRDFPYKTCAEQHARCVPPITRINGPDFVIHVGKTSDAEELPPPAKYRMAWAAGNDFPEQQGQLMWLPKYIRGLRIGPKPYSIILSYGLDANKKLTHARLIVPNSTFTEILRYEDLAAYKGKRIVELVQHAPLKRVVTPKKSKERKTNGEGTAK